MPLFQYVSDALELNYQICIKDLDVFIDVDLVLANALVTFPGERTYMIQGLQRFYLL